MQYNLTQPVKKLGRIFSLAALMWAFACGAAVAADAKIGFIDLQKAISSTKEWQKSFAAFKSSFTTEKSKIAQKEEKIKKMLEDLNKQSFILDPNLKKKKEDDFRKEKVAFERYVEDQNNEFAKKEKEMTQKLLKQMIEVIQKLGADKKFTIIFEKKSALYTDDAADVTDLAVKAYDQTYK